jgi:signal transduction histidine kinase
VKIILDGIQNENRANRLALSESEQQRHVVTLRFILALIAFAATGLFLVLYFFYNKRRLKEISLRQEISRDLHDDMNSTLSSIKLYSELSVQEQEKNSSHAIHITHRITTLTADLMSRVSDVIYVLKSEHLEPDMLSKRIKSVVHDLLIAKDIQAIWKLDEGLLRHLHAPLQIKNILLIIKEAVHNVAKYSEAKTCTLKLYQQNQQVYLEIQDDGIGMPEGSKTKGNGLQNMQFRCDQMQAEFSIQSKPNEGTCVRCIFPLSIFR